MTEAEKRRRSDDAVSGIMLDLCGRQGLGNTMEAVDEETREEIRKKWASIIYDRVADHG